MGREAEESEFDFRRTPLLQHGTEGVAGQRIVT
jgi:hypothetical protein